MFHKYAYVLYYIELKLGLYTFYLVVTIYLSSCLLLLNDMLKQYEVGLIVFLTYKMYEESRLSEPSFIIFSFSKEKKKKIIKANFTKKANKEKTNKIGGHAFVKPDLRVSGFRYKWCK